MQRTVANLRAELANSNMDTKAGKVGILRIVILNVQSFISSRPCTCVLCKGIGIQNSFRCVPCLFSSITKIAYLFHQSRVKTLEDDLEELKARFEKTSNVSEHKSAFTSAKTNHHTMNNQNDAHGFTASSQSLSSPPSSPSCKTYRTWRSKILR